MTVSDRRTLMLGRMALLCVVLMLATISLSAFIRLSQAGLGCDDWPACYGQSLRALKQSVAVPEYGGNAVAVARLAHRIVASVALVLVITMVLAALAKAPVLRREGLLSLALLSLALALAGLGVATPGARLPVVAMSNLLGGFAMLALSWRLVAATASRTGAAPAGLGAMGVAALALLASQITLGALVSASYSALACTDLADCGRAAQATGWDWQALNPWREPVFDATTATVNPAGALLPLLHRLGAFVMSPLLALLAAAAWRRGRRRAGAALLALTATQVVLGLLIVATSLPLAVVLLHNLVAALLLATLVRAI